MAGSSQSRKLGLKAGQRVALCGAAGHVSDITDNTVRRYALDLALVDVKVAAVDQDWSGLRIVWRTANR
jgi:hypothetical protein